MPGCQSRRPARIQASTTSLGALRGRDIAAYETSRAWMSSGVGIVSLTVPAVPVFRRVFFGAAAIVETPGRDLSMLGLSARKRRGDQPTAVLSDRLAVATVVRRYPGAAGLNSLITPALRLRLPVAAAGTVHRADRGDAGGVGGGMAESQRVVDLRQYFGRALP